MNACCTLCLQHSHDETYKIWTHRGKTGPVVLTNNHPPNFHASALLNHIGQHIDLLFACTVKYSDNIPLPVNPWIYLTLDHLKKKVFKFLCTLQIAVSVFSCCLLSFFIRFLPRYGLCHRKLRAVSFLYGSREMCRLKGQENGGGGSAWVLWDQVQIWASLHSLIRHSLDKQHSLPLNCEQDHLNPAGRPLRSRPVVLPILASSDKSVFVVVVFLFFVYHSMQIGSQLTEVKKYGLIRLYFLPTLQVAVIEMHKQTSKLILFSAATHETLGCNYANTWRWLETGMHVSS